MSMYTTLYFLFICFVSLTNIAQAQNFAPATTYAAGVGYTAALAVTDINSDGHPDIINANYFTSTIGVLISNKNSDFQPLVTYSVGAGSFPRDMAVQDVNNDSYPDVIVASEGINKIEVFLNSGNGNFQPTIISSASGLSYTPIALAVADVNGDGKPDIVAANALTVANTVSVFVGMGNGNFQLLTVLPTIDVDAADVEIGDVNGDAKPDIITISGNGTSGGIIKGNGNGLFQPAIPFTLGPNGGNQLKVGDLNGDNKLDLVFTTSGFSKVSVLLGNGNGSFQAAISYSTGINSYPPDLALSDINKDGKLDIILPILNPNFIKIMPGNGNGTFQPSIDFAVPSPYHLHNLVVTDVNNDGQSDFVLSATSGNNAPYNNAVLTILNATPLSTRAALPGTGATLSPNPADAATILAVAGLPANVVRVQATLCDATGRVITQPQALAIAGGAGRAELPTADLLSGLYVVRLLALNAQGETAGYLPTQRLSVE